MYYMNYRYSYTIIRRLNTVAIQIINYFYIASRPSSMSIGNTGGTELDTSGKILSTRVVRGGAGAG